MKADSPLSIRVWATFGGLAELAVPAAVFPAPAKELQKWIAGHGVPVRTIDAADQDSATSSH
jgi:hypothetical protein